MKKLILVCLITLSCSLFANAQKFKSHTVKQGETIEIIAKKYQVSVSDIYTLNPDAKKKLTTNTVLIIPNTSNLSSNASVETKELIGYETHKVRRKETLYSISKEYRIEIEDIKKHNKSLYADNLKKGDKIRIPRYKTFVSNVKPSNSLKTYEVQPKEGKWRVAYKFGISVAELETLNPGMNEVLQPGELVNVPNTADEKVIDDNFNYYTVQKSEGYYRLKVKLGLTQEQLEKLNPELKSDGLKDGMVLKVPQTTQVGEIKGKVEETILTNNLNNLKTKQIAVMLPFRLSRVDTDSVPEAKDLIKTDRRLSVSLDFHSGVLMAVDSAKQLGISTKLKVFDTEDQLSEVSKILNSNDFSEYDAVIGPLMANNLDRVARALENDMVPVISPITKPDQLLANVFQTIPETQMLENAIINFVKSDSLKRNVVIIADHSHSAISNRLKSEFAGAKQVFSRKNKTGNDAFYIMASDLSGAFASGKNYVFLETANEALVSTVTSMLNGLTNKNQDIILVSTNKTEAFEGTNVSNYHLANLKFHYPSPNKSSNYEQPDSFVKAYKKKYGIEPNKFAARGFDLTLDVLLRLASDENLYKASTNAIETKYSENKFRYSKKLSGGYYNEAVYIVKYTSDLTIEEAKL
ncbi:ABC-type branched-subunit amino acid transport system substrate-binding protein [Gelidibacter algens]|uniref:ABC-type branched-subunit amino acid transport system substrate-binding protein n=1 Tax=Gelidibacter algens TaxID=49280 RepID=A0A1A7QH13_9FLAO|nr:LysM peptidoglycan-binding domain-containing protein [Gelidibacter algens]OBX19310.1 peptidoglycan-binding protein [Gelidibacter algens]RAJ18259.1 ABC-type branched-subunit amino acid transport system substrate-binding protein [Gelidibacter algens]